MKSYNKLFSLEGKTAVITGGSRGIGKAIVNIFSKAGAKVVICSRKQDAVDKVAEDICEKGGTALPVAANISREKDRIRLIESAIEWSGGVDILVNNAGANPSFGGIEDLTESALDKVIDVNLKATLFLSQMVYKKYMRENGGVIINVSSIGGYRCLPGISGYNTIKAALNHLTSCMASEWGENGVRVNALAPGVIKTSFSKALWESPESKELIKKNPIQRFGEVEEVAGAALLLASEGGSYITGQTMVIDGGTMVKS